jgi:N-acetylmuramoyl-L-alanine amidase
VIALALALQLAAAAPPPPPQAAPGVLSIRASGATADVPVEQRGGVARVPVAQLAPVIAVHDSTASGGRHYLRIGDTPLELADGVPFARSGGVVWPLAAAPEERDGAFLVPYEVFAELLPRIAPTRWRFDGASRELTLFAVGEMPSVLRPQVTAASGSPSRRPAPARPSTKKRRRRVVVDAGHGGVDYGMRGPIGAHWQIHEKDITLSVAKKLAAELRNRGVDVIMTRTTDTLIGLYDRGPIANSAHGDVFVSVHVNAAPLDWKRPQDTRGYETYFLAEARTEDARRVARMENESIRFETGASAVHGDPLDFIINDMAQNEHLRESKELAELVQLNLGSVLPGPSRGVFQAGFVVLATAYMPAVLVEIGFGTNVEEARLLDNAAQQRRIASAIADATLEYLDHYERRLKAATP